MKKEIRFTDTSFRFSDLLILTQGVPIHSISPDQLMPAVSRLSPTAAAVCGYARQ